MSETWTIQQLKAHKKKEIANKKTDWDRLAKPCIILGECPSKSNSYRIGKSGLYKAERVSNYEKSFLLQCSHKNEYCQEPFEFAAKVYCKHGKLDLDNSLKVLLDCLQKSNTIVNDNKCMKISVEKFIDPKNPRVEYKILEYKNA